jgi:hypothetical protein
LFVAKVAIIHRNLEEVVSLFYFFSFLAILCFSQSDVDPQEDLAKFGYKLFLEFFLL